MNLLCIDPGTTESGVVLYDGEKVVEAESSWNNEGLLHSTIFTRADHLAVEKIVSYGMNIGQSTIDTCVWIGRFVQAFSGQSTLISRRDVKLFLCDSMRAKDKNVRQAILDRFPPIGGGKTPQIGTKSRKGPLYGISSHSWAALAVGITWFESHLEER